VPFVDLVEDADPQDDQADRLYGHVKHRGAVSD
jgi:hypothetical protein